MEWVAAVYAIPAVILAGILLKIFAPNTARKRILAIGIAAAWPALAAIIVLGR